MMKVDRQRSRETDRRSQRGREKKERERNEIAKNKARK